MSGSLERARTIVARALNIEPEGVGPDASIATLDAWNSIGHLRIILALEETLGRELDPTVVSAIEDVAGIARSLDAPG